MITRNWRLTEYRGLSTDTKPNKASNGAMFVEMDTKKVFLFDKDNNRWIEPITGEVEEIKTPIAYSYNGIILPPLPEWDKETYPYAFINASIGKVLIVSKEPALYGPYKPVGGASLIYWGANKKSVLSNGAWGSFGEESDSSNSSFTSKIWSNHDIINTEDGSVYLAASEPVPVYE